MHKKSVSLEKCSSETRFITPVWLWGSLVKRKKKNKVQVFRVSCLVEYTNQGPCLPIKLAWMLHWCSTNQMRETGFKICLVVPTGKHKWIFNSHLWLLHKKISWGKGVRLDCQKICYKCIMHQNYYIGWQFLLFYTKFIQFNYNLPLKYTILFMVIFKLFLFLL